MCGPAGSYPVERGLRRFVGIATVPETDDLPLADPHRSAVAAQYFIPQFLDVSGNRGSTLRTRQFRLDVVPGLPLTGRPCFLYGLSIRRASDSTDSTTCRLDRSASAAVVSCRRWSSPSP